MPKRTTLKPTYAPGAPEVSRAMGMDLESRLARLNTPSSTEVIPTDMGQREVYTPGVGFTSNDPLKGTFFEEGAVFGLDPLGIFDVPQIQTDIERLDPMQLADVISQQARRNIMESQALEREFDPYTAMAREESMKNFLTDVRGGGGLGGDLERRLLELADTDLAVPELEQSELLNRVRSEALRELDLGFALPKDVQNLVSRTAAGRTAGAGTMGSLGRDVAARDLGLTSLDLFDRRMDRASGLGAQEEATNIGQQGLKASIAAQNRGFKLGATQGLQDLRQQELANRMGQTAFTQGIQQPISGIDPGSLASFIVGDINMANEIRNKANVAQLDAATGAKSSQLGLMGDVFSGVMGMMCWVAREVYQDNRWKIFRHWLLNHADADLFKDYAQNGPAYAEELKREPALKPLIKWWMDRKIASVMEV